MTRRSTLGRPRAKDRPPGSTRAALLAAAADVFAERGYEGASIDAIAERAGVTGGALYKHFPSKAELLLAVVAEAVHALPLSERLAAPGKPSRQYFAEIVSSYMDPAMYRLRRLAIEIHAAASRDRDAAHLLLRYNRRMHRALTEQLSTSVAREKLPTHLDPATAASLLLVLIMGVVHLDTLEPVLLGNRDFKRALERTIEGMLGAD